MAISRRLLIAFAAASGVHARNNLARTPPMGWVRFSLSSLCQRPAFELPLRSPATPPAARSAAAAARSAAAAASSAFAAAVALSRPPPRHSRSSPRCAPCPPLQMSWEIFRCNLYTPTDDCTDKATTNCISEALYQGQTDAMVAQGFAAAGYATIHMECVFRRGASLRNAAFLGWLSRFSPLPLHPLRPCPRALPLRLPLPQRLLGAQGAAARPRDAPARGRREALSLGHGHAGRIHPRRQLVICNLYG